TQQRSAAEVVETLQTVGVAAVESFNAQGLFNDAHVTSRSLVDEIPWPADDRVTVPHDRQVNRMAAGSGVTSEVYRIVRPGGLLSATPIASARRAPYLGEH